MRADGQTLPEPLPEAHPGVTEWDNRKNGFRVVRVHYTADPDKRSEAWKRQAKQGLPDRGWAREFEISFAVPEGEPVFPEYDPGRMLVPVRAKPDARLLRFWDFGHVCPVTLFAQLDQWGRLCILAELVLEHAALEQQIESTFAVTFELMGRGDVACFDAGDPSGEKMTELGAVQRELASRGILLKTQPTGEGSYKNLRSRLLKTVHMGAEGLSPALLVAPRCVVLNEALTGGFHKSPKTGKPIDVHPFKDVCDALRYGNDNLLGVQSGFTQQMSQIAALDRAW